MDEIVRHHEIDKRLVQYHDDDNAMQRICKSFEEWALEGIIHVLDELFGVILGVGEFYNVEMVKVRYTDPTMNLMIDMRAM